MNNSSPKEKKIYLPHIHYTITVKNINKANGMVEMYKKSREGLLNACTHRVDSTNAHIYLKFPIKVSDHGTIGHEIIHLLQYIAHARDISFEQEEEHFAYMFQFIFNEIIGMEYYLPTKKKSYENK